MGTIQGRQRLTIPWLVLLAAVIIWGGTAEAALHCYDCHGTRSTGDNRPLDAAYRNITSGGFQGTHRNHLPANSGGTNCTPCHPGSAAYDSSHRDGQIQLSANIKNSPITARYSSPFSNRTTHFPQTATPQLGSCSQVNCHFEKTTPQWGSSTLTVPAGCSACHGAPPADGSHPATSGSGKKHGDYYGTDTGSCGTCHSNHNSFAHATSAGNPGRGLILNFAAAPNSGGDYSKGANLTYPNYLPSQTATANRNGSCSNLYCHSDGQGGGAKTEAVWGGSLDCAGCHSGAGDTTDLSGRHGKHTGPSGYAFSCERCHTGSVSGSDTINDRSKHVNKTKDVVFKEGGNYNSTDKGCSSTYCHSNAAGGPPVVAVKWTDTTPMQCYSCHRGKTADSTYANCSSLQGNWSSAKQTCTPSVSMTSNGHARLIGPQWIRKYPCTSCHNATLTAIRSVTGRPVADGVIINGQHVNGVKNIAIDPFWAIDFKPFPTYSSATKTCYNVYCHSDGTAVPDSVKPFSWTEGKTECNSCHGHPRGSCSTTNCHDGRIETDPPKVWNLPAIFGSQTSNYKWPLGQEWKAAIPMFRNGGAGTSRANSHSRHSETNFTCDKCHAATIVNGACDACHSNGIPPGKMGEVAHIDPVYHVNKARDVVFKDGGSFNPVTKSCSNTVCHTGGTDPVWGSSVNNDIICKSCHGTAGSDVDAYGFINGSTQSKINLSEWVTAGHGRPAAAGPYPISNNPAANFPGNPCWYCHDNTVLHNDTSNPFRLRQHQQFSQRFTKECVYCHMQRLDSECISCHVAQAESLAPQATAAGVAFKNQSSTVVNYPDHTYLANCTAATCHDSDDGTFANGLHKGHNANAGIWTAAQQADVKNQYMMMGVCLQCHDDDTGGKCTSCHTAPANNPNKYSLGFDPGTGFIKPAKARASSVHFGYKHYKAFQQNGVWRGGKFCWDCHDPHGDSNIYMIHSKVATTTEGTFGIPQTRADVVFINKRNGIDYARTSAPYNGICNVCHTPESKHYTSVSGDAHNASRPCTSCHEHRFSDSHADKQSCSSCHFNKPVPRHSGFGLPRDCTKCHAGTIGMRMDVMGQMRANSHHVQGVDVSNKHCYSCHWESTAEGLIDVRYHEGFNYKNYSSTKNAKVDLVVWGPGVRPAAYKLYTTAVQFLASKIDTANERTEAAKLTSVCISCHSDQNNDSQPFGDCRTPNQYAWDRQSVDARYSQTGTTPWGKYNSTTYPNVTKKDAVVKALSGHGNAAANQGGWSATTGVDGAIPNTRGGSQNVQCFDCHSSHGSTASGTTSSYVTFNGTRNGGNLKETQAGKGGYAMSYKAAANATPGAVNPYSTGAGQCFDCHLTQNSGITPWGYQSTFGATASIMGYKDTPRFGQGTKGSTARFAFRDSKKTIVGGHFKASSMLNFTTSAQKRINGLCTSCHDPHGVSPTLGSDQAYAVPMLKGTWMTSPYKEDAPPPDPYGDHIRKAPYYTPNTPVTGDYISWGDGSGHLNHPGPTQPYTNHNLDRNTFGGSNRIAENADKFAGLCVTCHKKEKLTDGVNKNQPWNSVDRIHESVKGWGANTEHSYTCSKCHQPHNSGLPRLMQTNCLDYKHRGNRVSGGYAWSADKQLPGLAHSLGGEHRGYPIGSILAGSEATTACHVSRFNRTYDSNNPPTEWPNENYWNVKTPW